MLSDLSLSPEVLSLIFEFAAVAASDFFHDVDLPVLCASSLVCQHWRYPAQRQLFRHLFLWGPAGTRRAAAYLASPGLGRYPMQHLEVLGLPVPLEVLEHCQGLKALTIEGVRDVDPALFHHPNLSGLTRLSIGGLTFAPSPSPLSPPPQISLTHLSLDLLSLPPPLLSLLSPSFHLTSLTAFLSTPSDSTHLSSLLPLLAPTLLHLSLPNHLPSLTALLSLSLLTSLESMTVSALEASKTLVALFQALPPSVWRVGFRKRVPGFAGRWIKEAVEAAKGVGRVDFWDVEERGEGGVEEGMVQEWRERGIRVQWRGDLL